MKKTVSRRVRALSSLKRKHLLHQLNQSFLHRLVSHGVLGDARTSFLYPESVADDRLLPSLCPSLTSRSRHGYLKTGNLHRQLAKHPDCAH